MRPHAGVRSPRRRGLDDDIVEEAVVVGINQFALPGAAKPLLVLLVGIVQLPLRQIGGRAIVVEQLDADPEVVLEKVVADTGLRRILHRDADIMGLRFAEHGGRAGFGVLHDVIADVIVEGDLGADAFAIIARHVIVFDDVVAGTAIEPDGHAAEVVDETVAADGVAVADDLRAAGAPFLVAGQVVALDEVVFDHVVRAAQREAELAVSAKDVVVDVRALVVNTASPEPALEYSSRLLRNSMASPWSVTIACWYVFLARRKTKPSTTTLFALTVKQPASYRDLRRRRVGIHPLRQFEHVPRRIARAWR